MRERVNLEHGNGQPQSEPIVPDGLVVLRVEGQERWRFVECDLGTSTGSSAKWRDWQRKVRAYVSYNSGSPSPFTRRFGAKRFTVMVVTTSQRRLQHLAEVTKRAGGGNLFWFTTFAALKSGDAWSPEIWKRERDVKPRQEVDSLTGLPLAGSHER